MALPHTSTVPRVTDRRVRLPYLAIERIAFTPRTDPHREIAMNTIHQRLLKGFVGTCVVAAPFFFASAQPAAAAQPAACRAAASSLDARLAAKADEGTTSLRRFVARTTTIYGLDLQGAQARAERARQARRACAVAEAA